MSKEKHNRTKRDISPVDIQLGIRLLNRKQTTVRYDEENQKIYIEIDISELVKE